MRKVPAEEQVAKDAHRSATSDDRKQAELLLEALVDLIAELDLAFRGHDPQEAGRPIAARQLRYSRAMRAVGDLLRSAGQAHLQDPLYELAEALHDLSEGRRHPFFEIDDSVRPGRGRPADIHQVWRLRANLCVGICWLMAGGQTRDEAIKRAVRGHRRALSRLERAGTKSLEEAIGAWLERLKNPTEADDAVAVALFKDEIAELEKQRPVFSAAELRDLADKRIEGVARRASEVLKKSN
jgi:hypothetical protein